MRTGSGTACALVLLFAALWAWAIKRRTLGSGGSGRPRQEDRRQALSKVGISVDASGISVEKDKFFLVNLNSDPSLNELLVYYLKEGRTLVGRAGTTLTENNSFNLNS